jgi:hypothetical protein
LPGKVINDIIRIRYLTFFQSGKQRLGRIQISDFVIKIGKEVYLLECQSYDDGSMAIRIADYSHAGIFDYLYQKDGKNTENNKDHIYISGWTGSEWLAAGE